jgi:hypothetical protein
MVLRVLDVLTVLVLGVLEVQVEHRSTTSTPAPLRLRVHGGQ